MLSGVISRNSKIPDWQIGCRETSYAARTIAKLSPPARADATPPAFVQTSSPHAPAVTAAAA